MSDLQSTTELLAKLDSLERVVKTGQPVIAAIYQRINNLRDMILQKQTFDYQQASKNPLNKFGQKCFSQTDEDGITLEIVRRLGLENGVFAEYGVGNGLENNTLILAALGWRGFWVGGEDMAFNTAKAKRLRFIKDWITLENICDHARNGLAHFGVESVDVISLDLDGNDIHFVKKLLENGQCPKLFIVEYNGKFIPPVRFEIAYDPAHQWKGDDYFGASLASFADLFDAFGYQLVCCNAQTGANAFFVRKEYAAKFEDVPTDIRDIYVEPRYYLYAQYGHRPSVTVVEKIFADS